MPENGTRRPKSARSSPWRPGTWPWRRLWTSVPPEYLLAAGLALAMLGAFLQGGPAVPGMGTAPGEETAEDHVTRAAAYWNQNRLDAAESEYRRALRLDPRNFDAHRYLGDLLYRAGRYQEAEGEYAAALALRGDADVRVWYGMAALQQGRTAEAVERLREATRADPGSFPAWLDLGISLTRLGEAEEAVAAFRRAREIQPDDLDAAHNLGYALNLAGRPAEAATVLEDVVRRDPDRVISLYELARAYRAYGRPDWARKTLEKLLAIQPDHQAARSLLESLKEEKEE